MMFKNIIPLLICIILLSCQYKGDNSREQSQALDSVILKADHKSDIPVTENDEIFKEYLKQFKKAALPISITSRSVHTESLKKFNYPNFKEIRGDRAFTDWWAHSQIITNNNFLTLITIENSRINKLVPVLETYTNAGQHIDSKVLDFGWEEYVDYIDSVAIDKNFNIYISGKVEEVDLDENEQEIPDTHRTKLHYIHGKVMPDGKIQLSETKSNSL